MRVALLGFAVAACTPSAPTPEAPAPEAPAPAPAPIEPAAAEPLAPAPAPVVLAPAPADEAAASEAEELAIARALEPTAPEAIAIVAVVAHAGERVVLHRFLGAAIWRARQRAVGRLEAREHELEERRVDCIDCVLGDDATMGEATCACQLALSPDPFVAAEAISEGPFVWEVARLAPDPRGGWRSVARVRLSDLSVGEADDGELAVSDLDGDGAVEIAVDLPVIPVTCSATLTDSGALAYVLRWDLAEQLAYTSQRSLEEEPIDEIGWEPIEPQSTIVERTLADRDGDGHADLELEIDREDSPSDDTTVRLCPYATASDAWQCGEPPPDPPFWRPTARSDCHALGILAHPRCAKRNKPRCRRPRH